PVFMPARVRTGGREKPASTFISVTQACSKGIFILGSIAARLTGGSPIVLATLSGREMFVVGELFSLEVASTWPFLSPPVHPASPKTAAMIPPNPQIRQLSIRAMALSVCPTFVQNDAIARREDSREAAMGQFKFCAKARCATPAGSIANRSQVVAGLIKHLPVCPSRNLYMETPMRMLFRTGLALTVLAF